MVAHARGTRRRSRVSGTAPPRVPKSDRIDFGPGGAPRVSQADGSFPGPRGCHRLYASTRGNDRSLRPSARGARAGPTAVFRDGNGDRRRGNGLAGRKPRRPAHKGRGQPASSRESGRRRRLCPGGRPRAVRSRPIANTHQSRRNSSLVSVPRCDPSRAQRSAAAQRRRTPNPDRVDQLTHVGCADPRVPVPLPVGAMAPMGPGQPRERARRREARLRTVRRSAVPGSIGPM